MVSPIIQNLDIEIVEIVPSPGAETTQVEDNGMAFKDSTGK